MTGYDDALCVILNPRVLPECIIPLQRLPAPKVWLRNYSEYQLETVIPGVISTRDDFEYFVVVSDDCVVSDEAFSAVVKLLHQGHPVVTGYCNLDPGGLSSITTSPPLDESPNERSYAWLSLDDVLELSQNAVLRTYHASMALTGMSRAMWERFPWQVYGAPTGWAADYHLSRRLHLAGVPIVAPRAGFIYHTKPDWRAVGVEGRRRVFVGERPAEVAYEL